MQNLVLITCFHGTSARECFTRSKILIVDFQINVFQNDRTKLEKDLEMR